MNGLKQKAETKVDKIGSGTFHTELAVCGQSLDKVVDEAPSAADGTPGKPRMGKPTENAPRVKDNEDDKKRRRNTGESESDSDSHEEGNGVSRTLLFGGNSRIRFKKRGKQTKKVAIKYKKTRSKRKRGGGKKKKVTRKKRKTRRRLQRGSGLTFSRPPVYSYDFFYNRYSPGERLTIKKDDNNSYSGEITNITRNNLIIKDSGGSLLSIPYGEIIGHELDMYKEL